MGEHPFYRAERVLLELAENEDEEASIRLAAAQALISVQSVTTTRQGVTTQGLRDRPE